MTNLRKENRDLIDLLRSIVSDMLMRGTKEEDGITTVEMSNGIWHRIHEAIKSAEAEGIGRADPIGKIPKHHKQWYEQMLKAAASGDLALMACLDAKTMETRSVIALVSHDDSGFVMTPVGHLCPYDNPYEAYIPPRSEQEIIR